MFTCNCKLARTFLIRPKGNNPTLANKSELDRNVNLVQWLNKRKVFGMSENLFSVLAHLQ